MKLNELPSSLPGKKTAKRKGRGLASGNGKTAGRGQKGQKARAGGYHKVGFEGGQMPLQRRLPKRGFTNFFKKIYSLVQVGDLEIFDAGAEIRIEDLRAKRVVRSKSGDGIKLLANGEITKPVKVFVDRVSQGAREKIEAAGGTITLVGEEG